MVFEETYDIKFTKAEIEWIIITLKQIGNFMDTFPQEIGVNDENDQQNDKFESRYYLQVRKNTKK